MGQIETGKAAPDFSLPDDQGGMTSLKDCLRQKMGNFIFLSERQYFGLHHGSAGFP